MKKVKMAIVGASGLVGRTILKILIEENLIDNLELGLYTSKRSAGKSVSILGREFHFELLDENALSCGYEIVMFSAGECVSRAWAKRFTQKGAFVIDNSNAFRRDESVPLVVPEINIFEVKKTTKLISNPNCSTIQLALCVAGLQLLGKIEKIVVSTYQSVSGAGKLGLQDLENDTEEKIKGKIKNNVICKIGEIEENDFCTEENKIMFELNKILGKNYSICASTCRVPVPYCHLESVYIKYDKNVNLSLISSIFNNLNVFLEKYDNISLPSKVAETNKTMVCRLRKNSENEISFFCVADNLRRGAGFNAVMIAKYIIEEIL